MLQKITRDWGSFIGTNNTYFIEMSTARLLMPFSWLRSRDLIHQKSYVAAFHSSMRCFDDVDECRVQSLDDLGNIMLINVIGGTSDKDVRRRSRTLLVLSLRKLIERRSGGWHTNHTTLKIDNAFFSCLQVDKDYWIGMRQDHIVKIGDTMFTQNELELAVKDGLIKPIKVSA